MAFIDGENLVARFEAMLDLGRKSTYEVIHQRGVYVWNPGAIWPGMHVVQRATFYTYAVGSEEIVQEAAMQIQSLVFCQYSPPGQNFTSRLGNTLYPRVFRKPKKRSGKGVDIQMTVDILCNTYQNNLDTVYVITGDGDYEPVISECQRQGKQVVVAALSSGLSPRLKLIADRFISLDNVFFDPLLENS